MHDENTCLFLLLAPRGSLPQHVVPQLLGFGTHGCQRGELLIEDFVRMGAFIVDSRIIHALVL